MALNICLFEDEACVNLHPLSLTRPVYKLRCGMTDLEDKILRHFPAAKVHYHCRGYLADLVTEENPNIPVNSLEGNSYLFINGRVLAEKDFGTKIDPQQEVVFMSGDTVVAAMVRGNLLTRIIEAIAEPIGKEFFMGMNIRELSVKLVDYPWHLVNENAPQIISDFEFKKCGGRLLGKIYPGSHLVNEKNIYIGEKATIKSGVVLDAEDGPIYISEGATVMANAVVIGPAFIGADSLVKIGAKIYEGTSIGDVCKIGGEVEGSIFHAYSNKQHEGFLGHAYIGEWCNFGADTNNSDLKNNYRNVKVQISSELIDTGSLFVGMFMGDHSKTGINTMFNTGTVVGVGCNVHGAGFPPRFIPSFAWGGTELSYKHDFEETIDTARNVMARRKRELTPIAVKMLRAVYDIS